MLQDTDSPASAITPKEGIELHGILEMRTRRRARETALEILYQCDTVQDWSEKSIEFYYTIYRSEELASEEASVIENVAFSRSLALGVSQKIKDIDQEISAASDHWSISRMARVDRNILRLSVYEILFISEIPTSVSINEAVELAKRYGSDDSPGFINGILDKIGSKVHQDQKVIAPKVANE